MKTPRSDQELLDVLLDAWRECPAPEYAAAIEQVSARLAAKREPVSTKPTQAADWLARAEKLESADVPILLETLARLVPASINAGLQSVAKWPADPRVDKWLLDAVAKPLSPGVRGRPLMTGTLALLERSNDPHVRDQLIAFERGEPHYVTARLSRLSAATLRAFEETVERLRAKRFPSSSLGEQEKQWLAGALERPARSVKDGEVLLRQVHESPADDSARLVYADWLTEQGDERGEFISLQVQRAASGGAPSKRERELEKKWARHWLGPLQELVIKRGLVYRRGFLTECAIENTRIEQDKLIGHPIFATVEKMDLTAGRAGGVHFANHSVCRVLHAVVGLDASLLTELRRQVKHLGVRHFWGAQEFAPIAQQPTLEVLELHHPVNDHDELVRFAVKHPTLKKVIAPGLELKRENGFR